MCQCSLVWAMTKPVCVNSALSFNRMTGATERLQPRCLLKATRREPKRRAILITAEGNGFHSACPSFALRCSVITLPCVRTRSMFVLRAALRFNCTVFIYSRGGAISFRLRWPCACQTRKLLLIASDSTLVGDRKKQAALPRRRARGLLARLLNMHRLMMRMKSNQRGGRGSAQGAALIT